MRTREGTTQPHNDWTFVSHWLFLSPLLLFAAMSETASVPITPTKTQVFLRRSVSTIILWTIVLWGLFFARQVVSDCVFLGFITLMALAGIWEFYGLARKCDLP